MRSSEVTRAIAASPRIKLPCSCAVLIVALIVGRAAADGGEPFSPAFTAELSTGPGLVFDTSNDYSSTTTYGHVQVVHERAATLAVTAGLGVFASERVALGVTGSCDARFAVCFAGPSAQVWPWERLWIAGGLGFGLDLSCIGRRKACGVDYCGCDTGGDGIDLRAGFSSRNFGGASVFLEYVQVGTFGSTGTANALSVQVGYQWH